MASSSLLDKRADLDGGVGDFSIAFKMAETATVDGGNFTEKYSQTLSSQFHSLSSRTLPSAILLWEKARRGLMCSRVR